MQPDRLETIPLDPLQRVILALALLASAAGYLWWRRRRHRPLQRIVRRHAERQLRDVFIPDGIGGMIHLDYLLLTDAGLVVLDVKRYDGHLFGGREIDQWTQVVRGKSFRFPNPLRENAARVHAVRALAPHVPVNGRVVFDGNGSFPKGHPPGVCLVAELDRELQSLDRTPTLIGRARDAWEHFERIVRDMHATHTAG